jgi:hypothetical protein
MINLTSHAHQGDNVRIVVRGKVRIGRVEHIKQAGTGNEILTLQTLDGFRAFKAQDITEILNETVGTLI